MSDLPKGMLSLFFPREPLHIPSEYEMEQEVWQTVGTALRFAMSAYEQTEEYQKAVKGAAAQEQGRAATPALTDTATS